MVGFPESRKFRQSRVIGKTTLLESEDQVHTAGDGLENHIDLVMIGIDRPANEVPAGGQLAEVGRLLGYVEADLKDVAVLGPDRVDTRDGFVCLIHEEPDNVERISALVAIHERIIAVNRHESVLTLLGHKPTATVGALRIVGIDNRANRQVLTHEGVEAAVEAYPFVGRIDRLDRMQDNHDAGFAEVDIGRVGRVVAFFVSMQIVQHAGEGFECEPAQTVGLGALVGITDREVRPHFDRSALDDVPVGVNHGTAHGAFQRGDTNAARDHERSDFFNAAAAVTVELRIDVNRLNQERIDGIDVIGRFRRNREVHVEQVSAAFGNHRLTAGDGQVDNDGLVHIVNSDVLLGQVINTGTNEAD